jgi:hypothetical protein
LNLLFEMGHPVRRVASGKEENHGQRNELLGLCAHRADFTMRSRS